MNQEQRKTVLQVLEHMRERPGMYFSTQDIAAVSFLRGFRIACHIFDPSAEFDKVYSQIKQSRGWVVSSLDVDSQMRERGFSNEDIEAEMLTIHCMAWEKIINQQPSDELKSEA